MKKDFYENDYFLGFDIGTNSVGWAVTDTEYSLLKDKGQYLWGVYLFEKAEGRDNRRVFRSARRRLARVRQRLNILQSLFEEEIVKIDPTFFIRLNNSPLFLEDKDQRITTRSILFNDKNYRDKDFFKEYPTIFHLRKQLMNESVADVRHLYLAIHHILKNRGHFLFEGQKFDAVDTTIAKSALNTTNAYFADRELPIFDMQRVDDALAVIKDSSKRISDAKKKLAELFVVDKKQTHLVSAISLILGSKAKLKDLYRLEDCDVEFDFKSADFDIKSRVAIENAVGADEMELVDNLKKLYDWSILCNILNGSSFVSDAKVKAYEEHNKDLRLLKDYVYRNGIDKKQVFSYHNGVANYAAYIGMDKYKRNKVVSRDEFYKYLKNTLKVTDPTILDRIENGQFMPKQISGLNCVIPYQLHLAELEKILAVAEERFEFLKKAQDGLTKCHHWCEYK